MSVIKSDATIITIGNELLIGQTIDTNSAWMAQELNKIGVWVHRRIAIGDVWKDIWQSLEEESKLSDIILITGGLGPTADDITKPLLSQYFGGKLVVDPDALANVKHIFEVYLKKPMLERNLKQAEVPDVCTVIQNKRGTAPGMWFEKNGKIFVSMPGVPHEMKGMMVNYVIPELQDRLKLPPIVHRTLVTAGIGESFLAERISEFESTLPSNITLAYLPNYGMVKLRLSSRGNNPAMVAKLEAEFDMLKQLIADVMVVDEDKSIQQVVADILVKNQQTLSTAESCTGGIIAQLITSIPGSSKFYRGGVVTYSNDLKEKLVGVRRETLEKYGAVSRETVIEMAEGILRQCNSDFAIATSGIMGPDGGTPEKPTGTVWVGLASRNESEAHPYQFRFDRQRNTELTAAYGLNSLRKFILD
jgi:nicotinamide-nucleotide amidase